jgi:hypothetical protein
VCLGVAALATVRRPCFCLPAARATPSPVTKTPTTRTPGSAHTHRLQLPATACALQLCQEHKQVLSSIKGPRSARLQSGPRSKPGQGTNCTRPQLLLLLSSQADTSGPTPTTLAHQQWPMSKPAAHLNHNPACCCKPKAGAGDQSLSAHRRQRRCSHIFNSAQQHPRVNVTHPSKLKNLCPRCPVLLQARLRAGQSPAGCAPAADRGCRRLTPCCLSKAVKLSVDFFTGARRRRRQGSAGA